MLLAPETYNCAEARKGSKSKKKVMRVYLILGNVINIIIISILIM